MDNDNNIINETNGSDPLKENEHLNPTSDLDEYFTEVSENSIEEHHTIDDAHIIDVVEVTEYKESPDCTLNNAKVLEPQITEKKKKNFFNRKVLSYIAVGLVSSILGGVISTGLVLYSNPNLKNPVTAIGEKVEHKTSAVSNSNTPIPYVTAINGSDMSVSQIVKKVGPAVVGVSVKSGSSTNPFAGDVQEGMGSGIIINEDGYVLTNYHVISGAETVTIILNSGKEVPAKIVNYEADSDVAVVKMTEKVQVPAVAELGDSDKLEVGETAIAIGNPLGRDFLGSVTVGVISAVNRALDGEKGIKFIQTDAAINKGNSGGALLNSKGQVIGINSAKIGGDGVEGLGFAIPINYIKPKMETLVKPILKIGISGQDITDKISKQYKLPVGFYIKEIQDFSPAEKAGLKPGDVVVKFDGEKVTTVNDINKAKGKHKDGDVVKIEVVRDGKTKTFEIKLSE